MYAQIECEICIHTVGAHQIFGQVFDQTFA